MAQYIGYFSVAIIVIVVWLVFRAAQNEAVKEPLNSDRMRFVVRPPRLYRVTGIVCSALFGASLVVTCFTLTDDPIFPFVAGVFSPLFALGLFIIYYSYRWRLTISNDKLLLTPLFRQDRMYSVRDVSHITVDPVRGMNLYAKGEKLFSVDGFSTSYAMLVSYLIEKGVHVPESVSMALNRKWF